MGLTSATAIPTAVIPTAILRHLRGHSIRFVATVAWLYRMARRSADGR